MDTDCMNFKKVAMEDKQYIDSFLRQTSYRGAEFSFLNLKLWGQYYGTEYTEINDTLVFRSGEENEKGYYYPISGDNEKCVEALHIIMEYTKQQGETFRVYNITEKTKEYIEEKFPGKFCFELDRDNADYIYNREDLMTLKGKKYHGKRNHINKIKNRDWKFEFITKENMAECIAMDEEWYKQNSNNTGDKEQEEDKRIEQEIIKQTFENYEQLGLVGGLLRVEGKVVAFTIGEPLTDDTFVVHFEKAFSDVDGAYPLINREFVTHACEGYKYINREEDMGVEGLRKAKLSYHPEIILTKYYMTEDCSEVGQ